MTLAIAILMKDPADAKTRLAMVLDFDAREQLALVMFENTLAFFTKNYRGREIGVVTPSARITKMTRGYGAQPIYDDGKRGINGAAAQAAEWAKSIDATSLLVIHADIPTLRKEEIDLLATAGKANAVVIGESTDYGTNALFLTPPDAIPFSFGVNSASAHAELARTLGRTYIRLRMPYLVTDIDTPDDLRACLKASAPPQAITPRAGMEAIAVLGLPEVHAGAELADMIVEALSAQGIELNTRDIVVVAQKIVSKSEGRLVSLSDYIPSDKAVEIGLEIGKDPRKVEAILQESTDVIRARSQPPDGLLITRHEHGWICANAGIDESNIGQGQEGMLLLLPKDPDGSAARIRAGLEQRFPGPIGVVITDTFGRPWRHGLVNIAIGVAGVPAIVDWTKFADAYGRGLKATLPAFADEIAAAAGLLMQKDAGLPVIVVRGLAWVDDPRASARDVLRPISQEMFL